MGRLEATPGWDGWALREESSHVQDLAKANVCHPIGAKTVAVED